MRKATSNVCKDGADQTRTAETRRDMGVTRKILSDAGSDSAKEKNNVQVCQPKSKTGYSILQDYKGFSGTIHEPRTESGFTVMCVKSTYRWSKT